MAVEGIFLLEIKGQTISREIEGYFLGPIHNRVKKIDPDVVFEQKNFGGLLYIFKWTGKPMHIDKAQQLLVFLKKELLRYFRAVEFKIKIDLKESRG